MSAERRETEAGDTLPWRSLFWRGFVVLVILVNAGIVWGAWRDKSWGALWFCFFGGPACNVALAATGLGAIAMRRRGPGYSLASHLEWALGLPAAAVAIDAVIIFGMPLHGC